MSHKSYCSKINKVHCNNIMHTPTTDEYGDNNVYGFILFRQFGVVIDTPQWQYPWVAPWMTL